MTEPLGRRERKKAQTRQALADAALRLFLERGYDNVGVKDVAEAADVAVTTLFKHFPSKEALVFDLDADLEAALVAAVRERPAGRSIPAALREHVLEWAVKVVADERGARITRMVEDTPALSEYARRMWTRHESALARAIAEETGAPAGDLACAALARFALEAADLVQRDADPGRAATVVFDLLEQGWTAAGRERAGGAGPREAATPEA
ncbi:TetR/AcrR family transcriptional regulator [Nonomuraea rhodomycinica]|uniref:TetR family transcriptional regulator n=1 Tax=Nonomuraea rhodomycinica TaxID=1712872 RepID=A0A7Y6MBV2_9ACTN|nr:TetR/AcrR family transcriptional regulator [Nonomuraea rhodomycinica]NUW42107.1 TetR family transcriptional regulator [Nonomuraea rhodomycinica]